MSLVTLVSRLFAETPEEKEAAIQAHRDELKNMPSDAENLTAFLSNCTTAHDDKPILKSGEHADLVDGQILIKKSH